MKGNFGSALLVTAALALALTVSAHAAPPQASAKQVRELMKVTGSADMMHRMLEQMLPNMSKVMQQSLPCVPASYWGGFANDKAEKELSKLMVPIYQSHFTSEDVADLLKFYRSRVGQKVLREMPEVMSKAVQQGQDWGRNRVQQMIEDLKKSGALNSEGTCPAADASSHDEASGM